MDTACGGEQTPLDLFSLGMLKRLLIQIAHPVSRPAHRERQRARQADAAPRHSPPQRVVHVAAIPRGLRERGDLPNSSMVAL